MCTFAFVLVGVSSCTQYKFWVNGSFAVPPFATSFSNRALNGCLLAVADEEGLVTLFDTRAPCGNGDFAEPDTFGVQRSKLSFCTFGVHRNAIFDVQWLSDDHAFVTAAGDGTVKVTSVRDGESLATLSGHSGSVKAVRSMPNQPSILASAGRDGNIMMWDLRCTVGRKASPTVRVTNVHKREVGSNSHAE